MDIPTIDAWFEANRAQILDDYFALLRFPSIGADPERLGDCRACADWIRGFLGGLGFSVEVVSGDSSKPPLVVAERPAEGAAHTVLVYGHYDVQPVDPIGQWETPPFEPTEREGRVHARGAGRPAIVAGLRGVIHFTLTLSGPKYDLHSGQHGGLAPNPAQGIAELVASLHNADGSIAVEGFCDGIIDPTETEFALATEGGFDENAYLAEVGVLPVGGERGVPAIVRNAFRPTIEVNGIHGGYGGPGSKTVIPTHAFAKLSCRLVPGQAPAHVWECLRAHFERHCPRGLTLALTEVTGNEPGFRLPVDAPVTRIAQDVLRQIDPRGAAFAWEGASIPIVAKLRDITGAAPLLVGFGMQEDRIHCPNESVSIAQFRDALRWGALIFPALA